MDVKRHFVVLLAIACSVNIDIVSTSSAKEAVGYSFRSSISVSPFDKLFFSNHDIQGTLILQPLSTKPDFSYIILLDDLKHFVRGKVEYNDKTELNDYKNSLKKPFSVSYNKDWTFKDIMFLENDTVESKNFKKSLVSFIKIKFQPQNDEQVYFTNRFTSEEETIHGKCNVQYTRESSSIIERKYDPKKCSNFVHNVNGYFENNEDFQSRIQKQVKADLFTVYGLDITKNEISTIRNEEVYEWYLNNANNDFSKQTVTILNVLIRNHTKIPPMFHKIDSLFLDVHRNLMFNENSIPQNEKSYGRIDKLKKYLTEASRYMEVDRLEEYPPGTEQQQIINKIQLILSKFTYEDFDQFYRDFKNYGIENEEMARKIIIYMIPYVGTKASLAFVKKLMANNEISDSDAHFLFPIMVSYAHQPTKDTLSEYEFLIKDMNLLKLKYTAILSFSRLLARVIQNPNASTEEYQILLNKYLKYFNDGLKGASNVEMKLCYIMALRNTESAKAVPYLLSVLEEKGSDAESSDRLRLAAIYALSKCIDKSTDYAFEKLIKILEDNAESRAIRIYAYDALLDNPSLSQDQVKRIDKLMYSDEHLKNYHFSHLVNLKEEDMLSSIHDDMMENIDDEQLSQKLSNKIIFKLKTQQIHEGPNQLKVSLVNDDAFPMVINTDLVEKIGRKFISHFGLGVNSNLYKLKGMDINSKSVKGFTDFWLSWGSWIYNVKSFETNYDDQELFKFLNDLKDFTNFNWNKVVFMYRRLSSFSIATGSGVSALFQHKIPTLMDIKVSVKSELKAPAHVTNFDVTFNYWNHGYTGISIFNPTIGKFHSVRRSNIMDLSVPLKFSLSLDFSKKNFKIVLPLITPDYQFKQGLQRFMASSVMISDDNDEIDYLSDKDISLGNYGYKTYSSGKTNLLRRTSSIDYSDFGLRNEKGLYNCDVTLPSLSRFAQFKDIFTSISKCGFKYIIVPDRKGTFKQIEITADVDEYVFTELDKPQYYLPAYFVGLKLSLDGKNNKDEIINIKGFELSNNYFFGQTFSTIKSKFSKLHSFDQPCLQYSKLCQYVNVDMEIHIPIYTLDASSDKILYESQILNYVSSRPFKDNVKILHSMNITSTSNENTNKICEMKGNFFYFYPNENSLKNFNCILTTAADKNLRNLKTSIKKHYDTENYSLLSDSVVLIFSQIYFIELIRSHGTERPEVPFHNEYQMSPPLDSSIIDDSMKKLGGANIKIINILPGILVNEDNKINNVDLTEYREIHSNDEANFKIFVKVSNKNKLAIKIYHDEHYLKLEDDADKTEQRASLSTVNVYFDDNLVSQPDDSKILYLPDYYLSNDKFLFGLKRIDDMRFIQFKKYPLIVYYSPNSIHILYNDNSRNTYNFVSL